MSNFLHLDGNFNNFNPMCGGPNMGPGGPGGPPGGGPPGGGGGPGGPPPPSSSASGGPAPSTVQPLSSNVLGKSEGGGGAMDQQYMQTSSQLYVFSTQWANRAAMACMNQEYHSIIAWHESQPETKKHLEVIDTRHRKLQWLQFSFDMIAANCS